MRRLKWVLLVILLAAAAAVTGFLVWTGSPLGPMPQALDALQSDPMVQVTTDNWYTFQPTNEIASTGLIFYPGGLVEPRSYAPYARAIAGAGYLVVIVPMPFNLAIFSTSAGDAVIAAHPEITYWAVGGHSLGGSMAARYASAHPDRISGLALWAAYPESGLDLSASRLNVVSVYAELDGLATLDTVEVSRGLLPPDAQFVLITGGNHAQFGWYGDQPRDSPATISRESQQEQTVSATVNMLASLARE